MCLAKMAYVHVACTVCVTNFSIGGKFLLVLSFMELDALTLAAILMYVCAYVLCMYACMYYV